MATCCACGRRPTHFPSSSTPGCSTTSCRSAAIPTVRSSRVDAALRARRTDAPTPNWIAGHQQPLSAAGAAGQDRHHGRRRLRRASRLRHRRRIATQPSAGPTRVRGARAALRRLHRLRRQPRRSAGGDQEVVDRDPAVRLHRRPRHGHRGIRQSQATSAAASTDRHRRAFRHAAARRRRARRRLEHLRRGRRRRRRTQCPAGPLLPRDWARPRHDRAVDARAGVLRRAQRHPCRDRPGRRRRLRPSDPRAVGSLPPGVAQWVVDELVRPSV